MSDPLTTDIREAKAEDRGCDCCDPTSPSPDPVVPDTEVCPCCDGQGDMQLHDEGGNGMYWGCMACGGTGRVKHGPA